MRCFVAVDIPCEEHVKILEIQKRFSQLISVQPVPSQSIHITLEFLGDLEENDLEKVKAALKKAADRNPAFPCGGNNICAFPKQSFFRVICVELGCKEPLSLLQKEITNEIEHALGRKNPYSRQEFIPHITIARVKGLTEKNEILKKIGALAGKVPQISFNISEIKLKQSILGPQGAKYTDVGKYVLNT